MNFENNEPKRNPEDEVRGMELLLEYKKLSQEELLENIKDKKLEYEMLIKELERREDLN